MTAVLPAALSLALLVGLVVLCMVVLGLPERLRCAFRPRRLAERRFADAVADGDFQQAESQARRRFALEPHGAVATGKGRDGLHPIDGPLPLPGVLTWHLGRWGT